MGKGVAEREINLWDMIWAVCLKWRSILAGAVILAILAGGFSYYKSTKEAEAAKAAKITAEESGRALDFDQKNNADLYVRYLAMFEEQLHYNENAPLMTLDAQGFYKGELTYYVDNHYKVEYPVINKTNNVESMVKTYERVVDTAAFTEKVKEATGNDQYVTEYVDRDNVYGGDEEVEEVTDKDIFTFFIYAADESSCQALMTMIKEAVEEKKSDVTREYGVHDIKLIMEECRLTSDAELLAYQRQNIDKLQTCVTYMAAISQKFTQQQYDYIDLAAEEMLIEKGLKKENAEVQVVPTPGISAKLVVIGFLGGAFLMLALWLVLYILNGTLRLEDDFERMFGVKVFGLLCCKEHKKKWFACIDKLFNVLRHKYLRIYDAAETKAMIVSNIKIAAKNNDLKSVYVTGAVIDNEAQKAIEDLKKELAKANVTLVAGKPVLRNAEALEEMAETGAVVLFETAGTSLYGEIVEEIEVCKHQKVNILGSVIFS